jgi:WD40 repeat protein
MTIQEALAIIDNALPQESLSDLQELVFSHAWEGKTYAEIAETCGYDTNYIKDVGSKLWQLLSKAFAENVTKSNFHSVLRRKAESQNFPNQVTVSTDITSRHKGIEIPPKKENLLVNSQRIDWGKAPDVTAFYGRTEELNTLKQWIVGDGCKLVALLGMGGIGKTALSVKLAEQIFPNFDYVIWRSLRNAPPVTEILSSLIQFLSNQQATEANLPKDIPGRISKLLEYLRSARCLLILDNSETIFHIGDSAGNYRPGYEGYGELFKQVGETRHQSCLVLTTQEKPKEFVSLEGEDLPVRSLPITGLSIAEFREIFRAKGEFSATDTEWESLIAHYAGNPLALKIVASGIQELFDGNVSKYIELLNQGTLVFDDIRNLLDRQFQRLSNLEKEVMYWLAVEREPVDFAELQGNIISPLAKQKLPVTLKSLMQRSLIEKTAAKFTQQPVVMEYITDSLIEKMYLEIFTAELGIFNSHAVLKSHGKDYVRDTQIRLIIQPILDKLLAEDKPKNLENRLKEIIAHLQKESPNQPGYTAGNILNLLCQLQTDLSGYDFSELTVWQAYLSQTKLHNVNFAYADLSKSVFAETLSSVVAVAFSPDGKLLATADVNGLVRLWEVRDRKQILVCKGHTSWVHAIAFSPDGQYLISGSEDQTLRLWDVSTGECLKTFTGHSSRVWSVAFNPQGTTVASGSHDYTVRLWNVENGTCQKILQGHTGAVSSVAFSPQGNTLISGSEDQTIRLWNPDKGTCKQIFKGHTGGISCVAFSPQGDMLATGSSDQTVRCWEVKTGQLLTTFTGHTSLIWSVAFSPQGNTLASGGEDHTVRCWDVQTGKLLTTLHGHSNRVWSVAFHPSGKFLASGSKDQTVKLWNINDGSCLATLQGYTNWVGLIAFSPDGEILASAHEDHTLRLWNVDNGACVQTLQGHTHQVWSVAFHPQGKMLASGSEDGTVRCWDVQTGKAIRTFKGHSSRVWSVAFSPDGRTLVSASGDKTIRCWDVQTGAALRKMEGHTSLVWSVAFYPQANILASGSADQTIKLWNSLTGECIETLQGHANWIFYVAFSPDGETLASAASDQTVKLWDVSTGECRATLQGSSKMMLSVAFSPDSSTIACGSDDHKITLWNVQTGEVNKTLTGHSAWVWSIAYSPDGKTLVSGSQDETIKVWDAVTGECMRTLRAARPYEGMNITGIAGLTDATINTLKVLGAVELTEF